MEKVKVFQLLKSLLAIFVIIAIDVLIRYGIEDLRVVEVNPRFFESYTENDIDGYFSSLIWHLVFSSWYYVIYFLVCYLVLKKLKTKKTFYQVGFILIVYLIFSNVNENLVEGFRNDLLIVSLISAIPIAFLTFRLLSFIFFRKSNQDLKSHN